MTSTPELRPPTREARVPYVLLAAVLILVGSFHVLTIRPGHDWGDDFALYVHHAKNIALGLPYARTGYVWNPRFSMMGPPTYPPVFPLMLAPIYAAAGIAFTPMKCVGIACFVGALALVALVLRSLLAPRYLIALLLVLGLDPYFWALKDQVLSDLPFFFFTYLALALIQARPGPERGHRRVWLHASAVGVATYLAYGTRSVGVVLIPCMLVLDRLRWKRIQASTLAATAVFVALAAAQAAVSHNDSGYAANLSFVPRRIGLNVIEYAQDFSALWDNAWWGSADTLLLVLFGLLASAGFLGRLRARPGLVEIFTVLYGLAMLPWIATQGRYLIPLMPLYVGYALFAVQTLEERSPGRAKALLTGLLAAVAIGFASLYATVPLRRPLDGVESPDATALWQAVERITAPEDVLICQKPRALGLYTDRTASGIHDTEDDDDLWSYVTGVGARYVVLGPDDRVFQHQEQLRGFIAAHPERFELAYSNPGFHLYRIVPAAAGAPR